MSSDHRNTEITAIIRNRQRLLAGNQRQARQLMAEVDRLAAENERQGQSGEQNQSSKK